MDLKTEPSFKRRRRYCPHLEQKEWIYPLGKGFDAGMKSEQMIITIDGPAGVGKTTISRAVASKVDIAYLDSGAMFRAIALALGEGAWNWEENRLREALFSFSFSFTGSGSKSALVLNNRPLSEEIRTESVGSWASHLGTVPLVREFLKTQQRELGRKKDLLAEGRDMGTVVFPEADYKFFLEAAPEERAKRRWLQLRAMSIEADRADLFQEMLKRDEQDRTRALAPLVPAKEAIVIDTTSLPVEEVVERIVRQCSTSRGGRGGS